VRFARHQELVELRRATAVPASIACAWPRWCTWWIEQVGDDVAAALALDPPFAAFHLDDLVEPRRGERVDVVDEALVEAACAGRDRLEGHAGRRLAPDPLGAALAVQRREVVEVDGEDVLERLRQAREEARPRRLVVLARERAHRRMQAMVGEPVGSAPACAGRRAAPRVPSERPPPSQRSIWSRRSLPQNGSPSMTKNGAPKTPCAIASSHAS
jgi:hypothetical protein